MPKVMRDEGLAERVRLFIERRGTLSAAAVALGVDKTLLWRFNRSGCAIGRTRMQLTEALARFENETLQTENVTSVLRSQMPSGVSDGDLVALRAFFQNMLNLVDAFDANRPRAVAMTGAEAALDDTCGAHRNQPVEKGQNGHS